MTAQGKGDALRECIADWREQAAAEEECQRSGGNPKGATAYRHCADDLESTLAEMQPASPTPSADLVKEARELDAKAMPGPWCATPSQAEHDGRLIARYRTLCPQLADALEKAEGEVRAVTASQDHLLVTVQRALRETIQRAEAAEAVVVLVAERMTCGCWSRDCAKHGAYDPEDHARLAAARKLASGGKGE